jgi:thiamine kinase-like enzyme
MSRKVVYPLQRWSICQPTGNGGLVQSKLDICKASGNAKKHPSIRISNVYPHQDISPRNLILDTFGYVWLIDWGFAGAYPPAFEAVTLTKQLQFRDFNQQLLQQIDYNTKQDYGWRRWLELGWPSLESVRKDWS